MRRSEAGGTVGQSDDRIRFFGSKSRRGEQNQDVGPWCKEWLAFLGKLRALRGFHPHKGAWHGLGDALGKSLVELLERGGRGRGLRWHSFRRLGAAQLRKSGAPMQTVLLWGGWKSPGVAKLYTDAPPMVEIRTHGRNTVAGVGGSGRENAPVHGLQGIDTCVLVVLGAGGNCICPKRRFTTCWEWVHGGGRGRGRGDGQRPRLAGEELKRLDRLAEQVSLLPGVKCHRREMVHKMILGMGDAMCGLEGGDEGLRVLSSTLGRVVEGGGLRRGG